MYIGDKVLISTGQTGVILSTTTNGDYLIKIDGTNGLRAIYHTDELELIQKETKIPTFNKTEVPKCRHDWYTVIGLYGPMGDTCRKCGINKEDISEYTAIGLNPLSDNYWDVF